MESSILSGRWESAPGLALPGFTAVPGQAPASAAHRPRRAAVALVGRPGRRPVCSSPPPHLHPSSRLAASSHGNHARPDTSTRILRLDRTRSELEYDSSTSSPPHHRTRTRCTTLATLYSTRLPTTHSPRPLSRSRLESRQRTRCARATQLRTRLELLTSRLGPGWLCTRGDAPGTTSSTHRRPSRGRGRLSPALGSTRVTLRPDPRAHGHVPLRDAWGTWRHAGHVALPTQMSPGQ
jgi:hypothetical protein